MRAVGAGKRVVDLPPWVELRVSHGHYLDALMREQIGIRRYARCHRCGREAALEGCKPDAERALGRFATWHRRCPDPALLERAIEQAPIDRAEAKARDEWFARRRRG